MRCCSGLANHVHAKESMSTQTMQALHDVVQSGKVRYVGMSSCYAHQFWQMQSRPSSWCFSGTWQALLSHLTWDISLCDSEQVDALHQHAKLCQRSLPRGGARDDSHTQALWRGRHSVEASRLCYFSSCPGSRWTSFSACPQPNRSRL